MNNLSREILLPRGWWRPRPVDIAWRSAVRAVIGANAVLVALVLAGELQLAAAAAFGGMTAVHARFEPFAVRARVLTGIGTGLIASVALGAIAAAAHWGPLSVAVLVATVAAVAKLLTDGAGTGPPGGLMPVFAVGTLATLPLSWADVGPQTLAAAAGAVVAWLVAMSGTLADPLGPVRHAVARACDAVLACRSSGDPHPAVTALDRAWWALRTAPARRRHGLAAVLARAEAALHDPAIAPGSLAADATALRAHPLARPLRAVRREPPADGLVAGPLSRLTGPHTPPHPSSVRSALHPSSPETARALRVWFGVLIAGLAAHGLGIGHSYWAGVAAAAVLQSANIRETTGRAVQRAVGTVAGAVLGAAILLLEPQRPVLLACVVLALFGAEMTVLRNYSYAMLFVTPLTVMIAALITHGNALVLVGDRVVGTVLGSALGVLAALSVPAIGYRTRLHRAIEEAEAAANRLRAAEDLAVARLDALRAAVALRACRDSLSGERARDTLPERARRTEHRTYTEIAEATRTLTAAGA